MNKKLCKLIATLAACLLCLTQPGLFSGCSFILTAYAWTKAAETSGSAVETSESAAEASESVTWPVPAAEIQAGAAIVMDADTEEVLWGREIHTQNYPASITKLLTALIVIENCSLDETVTFSTTAVSNLESGAVTIGAVAGDQLSVRDCLYALLLKSANEVANALAEHVAGSIDDFAVLMNRRAAELGCRNSDFRNPSGLTDSEHVTTAYDMGRIGIACMNNPTFMELESEPTRRLAGTKNYPDGLKVTIGHKMRRTDGEYYDSRVTAGKTGYTSAAGNTLVTMAEDRGRRVVVVVMKDKNPAHYTDTRALINFGLEEFETIRPAVKDLMTMDNLEAELISAGAIKKTDPAAGESNSLSLSASPMLTVPKGSGTGCARVHLKTGLPENAPADAVAQLYLSCQGHEGPAVYVLNQYTPPESENAQVDVQGERGGIGHGGGNGGLEAVGESPKGIGLLGWILIILLVTLTAFAGYMYLQKRSAEKRRIERRRKRKERLERLEAKSARTTDTQENAEGQSGDTGADANKPAEGSAENGQPAQTGRPRRHSRVRNRDLEHSQEEINLLNSLSEKE